jgi:hypothetical protein
VIKAFNHTLEEDTDSMKKVKELEEKVKKIEGHAATLTVTVGKKKGKEETTVSEKTKTLAKIMFDKPPVYVGNSLGLTINLGNFESAKVSAYLNYPCKEEDISERFEKGWRIVEAEIAKESEGVKGITKVKVTEE